jgi:hypothetical protein
LLSCSAFAAELPAGTKSGGKAAVTGSGTITGPGTGSGSITTPGGTTTVSKPDQKAGATVTRS